MAAQEGRWAAVWLLLEKGKADVNKADNNGSTPLFITAYNGDTEVVRLLVEEDKANVNKADNDGVTPLLIAAQKCHKDIVSFLVEKGARGRRGAVDVSKELEEEDTVVCSEVGNLLKWTVKSTTKQQQPQGRGKPKSRWAWKRNPRN